MPNKFLLSAFLVTATVGVYSASAQAQMTPPVPVPTTEIAAGCAVPVLAQTHHTFYVNPNAAVMGDGSEAKPFNSLSALITEGYIATMPTYFNNTTKKLVKVMPNAPIQPGDVVLLMSGNYGNILIEGDYSGPTLGFDNSDFITIEAAPGQTPVLGGLRFAGGGKWIFRDLTIQNISKNLDTRSYGFLAAFEGREHDIIFDHNTLTSATDTSAWSQADWIANASSGFFMYGAGYNGATCMTFTNNNLKNVSFGMGLTRGNNVLVKSNTINYFIHDGIDYGSNNLVVQNNVLTNRIDAGDAFSVHPDFIQGQPYGSGYANVDHYSNILFDSNICIRQTDPNMPFAKISTDAGAIQGIDTFNGAWNNIVVTNNVIITTTYQGISFSGVNGLLIANNTLLSDGNNVVQGPYSGSPSVEGAVPWITTGTTHEGYTTTNAIIRNNITNSLPAYSTGTIEVDHNLCVPINGSCTVVTLNNGKLTWNHKPGTYGDANVVDQYGAPALFVNFDPTNYKFNVNLLPNTPAVGTGNPINAPTIDQTGTERKTPIDMGALKFTGSKPFQGVIKIEANARQDGKPPILIIKINGQAVAQATVTADVHFGQLATYTYNFNAPSTPTTLDLVLDGYGAVDKRYVSLNVFKVYFGPQGGKVQNLLSTNRPKVISGNINIMPEGAAFETDNSTLQFNFAAQTGAVGTNPIALKTTPNTSAK